MVRRLRKTEIEDSAFGGDTADKTLTADLPIRIRTRGVKNRRFTRVIPAVIIVIAGLVGFLIPTLQKSNSSASTSKSYGQSYEDYSLPLNQGNQSLAEQEKKYVDKQFATVKTNDVGYLNVRSEATASSAKLGQLQIGDKVEVLTAAGDWVNVKLNTALGGKSEGWVSRQYVDVATEKVEVK